MGPVIEVVQRCKGMVKVCCIPFLKLREITVMLSIMPECLCSPQTNSVYDSFYSS
jgi:hypothetical protein